MKVKFKYGIRTYSGTLDEMTYGSYKNDKVCIGRRWVMPKVTENNTKMGNTAKNIADLWADASEAYKSDFKVYAEAYGKLRSQRNKLSPNAYGIFVKALYAWADSEDPVLDLSALTFDDITALGGAVNSISSCVTNEFLPAVRGWEDLDSKI